jgi:predicted nucleic acid-binding protein
VVIDTNIILRYLLEDNPDLTKQATTVINSGDSIILDDVVIMECVYVLTGVYKMTKSQSSTAMSLFIKRNQIDYNSGLASYYLDIYAQTNLDLADCYLIALALKTKQELKTFDKQMLKVYQSLKAI